MDKCKQADLSFSKQPEEVNTILHLLTEIYVVLGGRGLNMFPVKVELSLLQE